MVPIEYQIKPYIFLVLITSIVSLCIIYSKTNENIGNKREISAFRGMLISFLVYTLVDFRMFIGREFYSIFPSIFVRVITATGFVAMSFSSFFWFLHVQATMPRKTAKSKLKFFWLMPLVANLILLLTPLNHLVFEIQDGMIVFSPFIGLILLMDYVYMISALVMSIFKRKNARTRPEKKKYSSQILFIFFYTISGMIIGFMMDFPAIEICVNPVVFKLFLELQDSQIYTDALTKLYNRRRMTDIISEEIATCSAEKPLTIIMIDLDYFKHINDILGHDEGDKALVTFSKALRTVSAKMNAVAARWGGDEFIVAGKDPALPHVFGDALNEVLSEKSTLGYQPLFSIGIYNCTSPEIGIERALVNADQALYKDKEARHQTTRDFIYTLHEIKNQENS
jgi:diguanylate cyclase (GGDEF)-like protein